VAHVFALRQGSERAEHKAIVHELNNLLTAIGGYAQLIVTDERVPPAVASDVAEIAEAATRAGQLVRKLQTGA
jgi:signal transduction histidine kinase